MDTTKQIMNKWYSAMEVNNISVQPKAATILGTILSEYTISKKEEEKDLWSEFLTITGGQFKGWYESLSEEDLKLFHEQRSKAKKTLHTVDKTLLKG